MGLFRGELGLVCCGLVTSGRGIVAGKSFEELYQEHMSLRHQRGVCVYVQKEINCEDADEHGAQLGGDASVAPTSAVSGPYVCPIWCPVMLVFCADSAAAVSAISSDKHGSNHGETFQADATDYVNLKRPSYYRQDHAVSHKTYKK